MTKPIFSLCLLLLSLSSFAVVPETSSVIPYTHLATIQKLSKTDTWKKLLVYEPSGLLGAEVESAVLTKEFFLAPDGRTNPEAELLATLQAFSQPVGSDPDSHAQCRFPARYQWLKSELGLTDESVTPVHCPEFFEWSEYGDAKSLSIIFASGYLGNPASYYGHTLLKLNSKDKDRTQLLDTSVNFGAIVEDGEDPVSYIFKGLFGGYKGGFSHAEYYFHNQNYGELELRDLWEYELDLTPEQVDFVLAHTWEVMGKEYQYFFLNKNCSFRLGELLEIIDGVKANPDNDFWVIPQSQILELDKATLNGKPLVKAITFQPSRQFRLYNRFRTLQDRHKSMVAQAIANPHILDTDIFQSERMDDRFSILDTLLDYYQFIGQTASEDDEQAIELAYHNVLAHRYTLPPGGNNPAYEKPVSPDEGRDPGLIQLGPSYDDDLGGGMRLNVRPAYYDSLDGGAEHAEFGELIMGQVELSMFDDKVILDGVDFISIQSLATEATGLPGDGYDSWRLKAGLQPARPDCSETCLTLQLEGDRGYTAMATNHLALSGFVGAAVRDNKQGAGNLEGRITVNAVARISEQINALFEYQHKKQIDGSRSDLNSFRFDTRYQISKNRELRFSYEHDERDEFTVLFGHYW